MTVAKTGYDYSVVDSAEGAGHLVQGDEIEGLLALVCDELGMDEAFIGRLRGGRNEIRYSRGPELQPGDSDPYGESYCRLVVEGGIPHAIPDTSAVPALSELAATHRLRIASYLGIPLRLSDGSVYGTLCAYSHSPQADLTDADARLLRLVGRLVASRLERDVLDEERNLRATEAVELALANGEPAMVFQPILNLESRVPVGFEALARFAGEPYRAPDVWIAAATAAGLGVEVEVRAVENALVAARRLPLGGYLSVNASPSVVTTGLLLDVLKGADRPVVVEVTEHERAEGDLLLAALQDLRTAGHRVALDDGGSGYSGLAQVLQLKPEVMKMDRTVVSGIDSDPIRRALVGAGTMLAEAMGGDLIAEGVETEAELAALQGLGVTLGQGFLLGRPAPAETWAPPGAPG